MKSVISEMLQYDIKPDVMQDAAGAKHTVIQRKCKDTSV